MRECPGCTMKTERMNVVSCGHIKCANPKCKKHWCWLCRTICNPDEIYEHMRIMHPNTKFMRLGPNEVTVLHPTDINTNVAINAVTGMRF